MKLIGNPKEKEEGARTEEEKRELVEKAKMKLDDTELEQVAGGASFGEWKRAPEGGYPLLLEVSRILHGEPVSYRQGESERFFNGK